VIADESGAAARRDSAALVHQAMRVSASGASAETSDERLTASELQRVAAWDRDIEALVLEARRRGARNDPLPALLSATSAVYLLRDPEAARRRMRRPLPSPPAEAARRGTRFHQWVETRFGQVPLIDLDGLGDDSDEVETLEAAELAALQEAFLAGPFADKQPLAVEAPFQMVLGDATVSGRIDAVYGRDRDDHSLPDGTLFEVVDWKTGQHAADELQLALYRLAWAELKGVPIETVAATFYYVATGKVERPVNLPDRQSLTKRWEASTA
jgi:DNA helicase-2/ATP-dependent DNA helicase PcrA